MTVPKVVYRTKPKNNSWARWMTARTSRKNKNNLVSIVGKTGSGKTWAAMAICEMMANIDGVDFGIDHIVFSLTELMELINSGKLESGSKIIFDEPQISISAREFQSQANKVFNYLVSTFRHRNFSLFFCTPFESLLDKSTRKMFHVRMETMGINENANTCKLKPRYLEWSDWKSEPYRKQLIVITPKKEGEGYKSKKLFSWDVPKPSKELIKKYEKKKRRFTDTLNKNIHNKLKQYAREGKSMAVEKPEEDERKKLTDKQKKVMKTIANTKNYEEASKELDIDPSTISRHKKLAKKKGYEVEEFKN